MVTPTYSNYSMSSITWYFSWGCNKSRQAKWCKCEEDSRLPISSCPDCRVSIEEFQRCQLLVWRDISKELLLYSKVKGAWHYRNHILDLHLECHQFHPIKAQDSSHYCHSYLWRCISFFHNMEGPKDFVSPPQRMWPKVFLQVQLESGTFLDTVP